MLEIATADSVTAHVKSLTDTTTEALDSEMENGSGTKLTQVGVTNEVTTVVAALVVTSNATSALASQFTAPIDIDEEIGQKVVTVTAKSTTTIGNNTGEEPTRHEEDRNDLTIETKKETADKGEGNKNTIVTILNEGCGNDNNAPVDVEEVIEQKEVTVTATRTTIVGNNTGEVPTGHGEDSNDFTVETTNEETDNSDVDNSAIGMSVNGGCTNDDVGQNHLPSKLHYQTQRDEGTDIGPCKNQEDTEIAADILDIEIDWGTGTGPVGEMIICSTTKMVLLHDCSRLEERMAVSKGMEAM